MHNPSPETPADPGMAPGAAQMQRAQAARPALYVGSEIYRRAAFGKNHPLNIVRHSAVLDLVRMLGWLPADVFVDTRPATVEELLEFHDPDYLEALQYAQSEGAVTPEARERYRIGTLENPVFDGLFERASMTVGGSIQAAKLACEGNVVFHPSGGTHHGRPDRASGFCYFNDPVFAIRTFLELGRSRVLYVDLDAHHGDGVEDAFIDDARVMTVSVHEEKRWPYSGKAGRRGTVCNLPVPRGFNDSELDYLVSHAILPLAAEFSPDAIVLCCGADCLAGDPLSAMELSNVALWDTIDRLLALEQPTVILGGGGYNPWTVARYWAGLWGHINGREMPARLPDEAIELLQSMECDLIDEEDIEPQWLTTMADTPDPGSVRDAVKSVANVVIGQDPGNTHDVA
jgi:acetoin utilization protein AcuC